MNAMEECPIFADRKEAGAALARILEEKYKDRDVLVLGIPRGGVIVAHEIARQLHGELSTVITKKLPHPRQEELAIGAAAEDGSVYLTSLARGLSEDVIRHIIQAQQKEIQSRIQRFRNNKPLPSLQNRIVILVDDGIATGSTIVPAIQLCKGQKAAFVVVAAPVSGDEYASEINDLADEVVIACKPPLFYAVGQAYEDFHHVTDKEVTGVMNEAAKHYHHS